MSIGCLSSNEQAEDQDIERPDAYYLHIIWESQPGSVERNVAHTALIQKYESAVFAIVLRRLRNRARATDVTQDVFIKMFKKIDQLRDPERFSGWLKQIAVRLAINNAVRRTDKDMVALDSAAPGVTDSTVDTDVFRHERQELVMSIMRLLPEQSREVLDCFYLKGMSLKEIEQELTAPIGTIKRRLFTARKRMYDAIKENCPEYAENPLFDS